MLRSSLQSAKVLGSTSIAAAAGRQLPIATSRRLGARSYAKFKRGAQGVPKPPILPASETLSSEREPPPLDLGQGQPKGVKDVPLTPPTPSQVDAGNVPHPSTTIDDVGESKVFQDELSRFSAPPTPPPPPPPQEKKGTFRRLRKFVLALLLVGVAGFGGGVWYARINDNFHDFFTEYIPYGERAVLALEELDYRKRFPQAQQRGTLSHASDQPVRIPAQSGASWRVSDKGESAGRHSNASPSRESKSPSLTGEKPSSEPLPAEIGELKTMTADRVHSQPEEKPTNPSFDSFKPPEVNEPSRFPPIKLIDLMELPDANEPIVRDLVHMLNDVILVINADGAHAKYASTMDKAKNDIIKMGDRLKTLKTMEEKKAAAQVKSSIVEFDKAATQLIKRVEQTMVVQELEWRKEYEEEMSRVQQNYDERVNLLIERERQLNEARLRTELMAQALALKKEFVKEVEQRVEQERQGRLSKLKELSAAVSELGKLTAECNEVVDSNLKTQQLHVAVEAVRASLEDAQHPQPFIRELVALKEIAADDPVVNAAIASVTPAAYQRGISSPSQLIDRFRRVAGEVRKASLLPEDAGVASHASSWMLSHMLFKKQGLAQGSDVESILTRTQTYLEQGNLDAAAREMNGLDGWAKTLSKDWLSEVRKVLEVQQALDVIATEARLQSLRID
ncbi:hypothetical protein CDD81_6101 [Ophiocordyceps australis]|uniref:MICOS complex subunit MIC60 n=1 Tax=Ophiocordyceps australis TaxID=1399860 RepID=A0A2C5Y3P9_9HYPO|nr:hypothetical protein CDD81_6101 [Ophiocordyceps australis]